MALFFTADTHFDHDMIMRHANRPWANMIKDWNDREQVQKALDAMNEELVGNWNAVVGNADTVFVIGDYAWSRHGYFLKACNGKKTLIVGSHDRINTDTLRGFVDFTREKEIKVDGVTLVMHHTCLRLWEKGHYGAAHLFGHSHGRLTTFNMSFDVGVDSELASRVKVSKNDKDEWKCGYAPIPLDMVLDEVDRRRRMMEDAGRVVRDNKKTIYRQDDVAWITMNKVKQDEYNASGEKRGGFGGAEYVPDPEDCP